MLHLSAYSNCKQFLGLLPKPLYHSPLHTVIWHVCTACNSFLQWSGNVNCTALSLSGMHNISASPIAQHALCLELYGPHGSRHCCAAGRSHCWVYPDVSSWSCDQILKHLTGTVCTNCVTTDLNSGSRGLLTSLWFCMDRFNTWCATFKHWCSVICTSYSPSQKYSCVQISSSTFPSPTCTRICTAKAMLQLSFSCTYLTLNCTHSVIVFLKNTLLDKNRMFRKITDHKWKEVTLRWRNHTHHFSPNHIRMIKSRQMKGDVHTAHMGEN